jgi:hypothetical protein
MPSRLLALLVLLAVVPSVELVEQLEHAVAHVFEGEAPEHSAHHDEQSDEHGCTGLVHLCSCHQAQVTFAAVERVRAQIESGESPSAESPPRLTDLNSLEPPQRPPIG